MQINGYLVLEQPQCGFVQFGYLHNFATFFFYLHYMWSLVFLSVVTTQDNSCSEGILLMWRRCLRMGRWINFRLIMAKLLITHWEYATIIILVHFMLKLQVIQPIRHATVHLFHVLLSLMKEMELSTKNSVIELCLFAKFNLEPWFNHEVVI